VACTVLAPEFKSKMRETKEKQEETTEQLKKEKIDTARRMKTKGYAVEDIAEITGLTAEEIEGL